MKYTLAPLGDRGITVTLGDGINTELSNSVVQRANAVSRASIRGVTDVVPSYASFGVFYNPLEVSFADLGRRLETALIDAESGEDERVDGALMVIPVAYDGEDMEDVCRRTRLTRPEVIEIHSGREYHVLVVGFVPGFAYLGPLDPRLIVPRRESPRKRVPAGSVAIAEAQTGIYPSETPGGWNIIGTTTQRMFDVASQNPALLRVGDIVKFEAAT